MKKSIIYILILICLFVGCGNTETVIRFRADSYNGYRPGIMINGSFCQAEMDSVKGTGEIKLQLQHPALVEIGLGKYRIQTVYVEPGAQLELSYSCLTSDKKISIGGDLAAENTFIQSKDFYIPFPPHNPRMPLSQALKSVDSVSLVNRGRLNDETGLADDFKKLEIARLELANGQWLVHRMVLCDTIAYIDALRARMPEGSEWMEIPGYTGFMKDAVRRMALVDENLKSEGRESRSVEYILKNIQEPQIKAYLLDLNIMPILSVGGIAGNEQYVDIYRQYITDTLKLKQLDFVCEQFGKIAVGQPCPAFSMQDINDKTVTTADLAGKYVYIDLWATWCGPCKGEMPALQELEKQFAGEDIAFVSISVDRNKDMALWKKTVADMKLGGIQLHLGENWEWLKNFMPASISVPRFILLDKEGKIIHSNMTQPSDKATAQKLKELTKI